MMKYLHRKILDLDLPICITLLTCVDVQIMPSYIIMTRILLFTSSIIQIYRLLSGIWIQPTLPPSTVNMCPVIQLPALLDR